MTNGQHLLMTQMDGCTDFMDYSCCVASSSQDNGLQVPAFGKFSYTDLHWSHEANYQRAFITKSRLADFIAGEEDR